MPRDEDLFPDPTGRPTVIRPGATLSMGMMGGASSNSRTRSGRPGMDIYLKQRDSLTPPAPGVSRPGTPPPDALSPAAQSNAGGHVPIPGLVQYDNTPRTQFVLTNANKMPESAGEVVGMVGRDMAEGWSWMADRVKRFASGAYQGAIAGLTNDFERIADGYRNADAPPQLQQTPPPAPRVSGAERGMESRARETANMPAPATLTPVPPAPARPGSAPAVPWQQQVPDLPAQGAMPANPALATNTLRTMGTRTAGEQATVEQAVAGLDSQTQALRDQKEWMKDFESRQNTGMTREELKDRNLENRARLNERAPDPNTMSMGQIIAQRARNQLGREQRGELAQREQTRAAERIATQQTDAQREQARAEQARNDRQYALDVRKQTADETKAGWDIRLAVEDLQSKSQERIAKLDPFARLGAEAAMAELEELSKAKAEFGESLTPEEVKGVMQRAQAFEAYSRRQSGYFRGQDGQLWGPEDMQAVIKADPEVKSIEDVVAKYNLQ